jgi:hypothetical protein
MDISRFLSTSSLKIFVVRKLNRHKKALRRAHNARRQPIWRRVARYGALRAVGGKRRSVGRSALFERVSAWFYGDAGGSVLSLPELNWRYAIRRRVGGNAGFYLGLSLIVRDVVCLVVRMRSVSAPDECMSVFPYELEPPPGQVLSVPY